MVYNKNVRMAMYIVTLLILPFFASFTWINTTPSDDGSVACGFFGLGAFSIVYGWRWVRHVGSWLWGIRDEDALKLARGISFEAGTIFIVLAIMFSLRYYVNS